MSDLTKSDLINAASSVDDVDENWSGMTLDELRYRRALSLVKLEAGKGKMANTVDALRNHVSDNGIRGLLFSNNMLHQLKTVDYLILGFKASRLLARLWRRFR
jgi:hypothetical protein